MQEISIKQQKVIIQQDTMLWQIETNWNIGMKYVILFSLYGKIFSCHNYKNSQEYLKPTLFKDTFLESSLLVL